MVKLENINQKLEKWDDAQPDMPTMKDSIILMLATGPGIGGDKTFDYMDLGLKLKKSTDDIIEIEKAELKILSDAVRAPSSKLNAWAQGQIKGYLDRVA